MGGSYRDECISALWPDGYGLRIFVIGSGVIIRRHSGASRSAPTKVGDSFFRSMGGSYRDECISALWHDGYRLRICVIGLGVIRFHKAHRIWLMRLGRFSKRPYEGGGSFFRALVPKLFWALRETRGQSFFHIHGFSSSSAHLCGLPAIYSRMRFRSCSPRNM